MDGQSRPRPFPPGRGGRLVMDDGVAMTWHGGMRTTAARWLADGIDLLLPPRCAACGRELTPADGIRPPRVIACAACVASLCRDGPRCGCCGAAVPAGACGRCRGVRRPWDGIVVLGSYADELRTTVLRIKRPAGERLAATLAALFVERHRGTLAGWNADVVVPVPMHWLRRTLRGTSAAGELARGMAAGLGLPCRGLVRRCRATVMQNRLPVAERRGNVHGAFRAGRGAAGKRILLVDDVTTTGATLEACTEALISAGAAAVYAAAVARADGGVEPADA